MIPFVGLSRTTGTVIGPGIELQSVRALTKLTKATEEPLFVFNSLAVWAQALMLNSTRLTIAAGMDLRRFFISPSAPISTRRPFCTASKPVTSGESGTKPVPNRNKASASDGAPDIVDHMGLKSWRSSWPISEYRCRRKAHGPRPRSRRCRMVDDQRRAVRGDEARGCHSTQSAHD